MRFTTLPAAALLLATGARAIPKITRSGRYLYDESGTRFFIKGIAYQEQGEVVVSEENAFGEPSTFIDPLALPEACARDLPTLQSLGVNVLRIYSVDSAQNHDACMKTFSDAGIYTIIDLALPVNGSIDRTTPSWSTNLLDQYTKTIDAFSGYGNAVLSYNVGNEVTTEALVSAAPFVKAAARDTKAYLKSKNIPALVGYAAIDGPSAFRGGMADFMTCGSDETSIDIYGLNNYAFCGDATYETTYKSINDEDFQDFAAPLYFSEYGCVQSGQTRSWAEVPVIFGDQMTSIWSGGVAFSYFPASSVAGQFGMVTVSGNTVTTSADFDNLKTQYAAVNGPNSPSQGAAASSFPACAASSAGFAVSSTLPGTPNESECTCLDSAASCQYRPQTADFNTITGEIINFACSSLLPGKGLNCDDIGGNGTTGTYGRLAGCSPNVKLTYLMASYYEAESKNAQACSFAGNGTVNTASTAAASAAAGSCIANPAAVSTPSSAPGSQSSSGSGSGGNSGSGSGNSAMAPEPFFAVAGLAAVGFFSAVATLL